MELSKIWPCAKIEVALPLLKNGRLPSEDRLSVERHLQECAACAELFARLSPIFDAVREPELGAALFHLTEEELENFVLRPKELSSDSRAAIELHLRTCEICSDLASRLQELPADTTAVLNSATAPLLTQLDREILQDGAFKTELRRSRPILRSAFAGYVAVASVFVLILYWIVASPGIRRPNQPQLPAIASVDAEFPVVARSSGDSLIFLCPTERASFTVHYNVGLEPGHHYSIRVAPATRDTILQAWNRVRQIDSLGWFSGGLLLDAGHYRLTVLDIVDNDTVTVERPFELRLVPK